MLGDILEKRSCLQILVWVGLGIGAILESGLLGRGAPKSLEISDPEKLPMKLKRKDSRKNYLPEVQFML
jgi:hypothetical protein